VRCARAPFTMGRAPLEVRFNTLDQERASTLVALSKSGFSTRSDPNRYDVASSFGGDNGTSRVFPGRQHIDNSYTMCRSTSRPTPGIGLLVTGGMGPTCAPDAR